MAFNTPAKNIIRCSKSVRRAIEGYFEKTVACPLGPSQGRLLGYLADHPGMNAGEIQTHFEINKSTASDLINSLVERGMITYERDVSDARKRVIVVTEKGKEHQEEFHKSLGEIEEKLSNGLSEAELIELERLLAKVMNNTEEMK